MNFTVLILQKENNELKTILKALNRLIMINDKCFCFFKLIESGVCYPLLKKKLNNHIDNLLICLISFSDHVYVAPSANQVRSSDVRADDVFQVSAETGNVIEEPTRELLLKPHDMTPVHLDIFKGIMNRFLYTKNNSGLLIFN